MLKNIFITLSLFGSLCLAIILVDRDRAVNSQIFSTTKYNNQLVTLLSPPEVSNIADNDRSDTLITNKNSIGITNSRTIETLNNTIDRVQIIAQNNSDSGNCAEAYYNRGLVYARQQKDDLALANYNKAIEINPQLAKAYFSRGLVYARQQKYNLALADFTKLILTTLTLTSLEELFTSSHLNTI